MLGVIVNTVAVLFGGFVGLLVNKGLPQRFSGAIMTGIGLCTMFIGISGALQGENPIILVISIVLGAVVGTALRLDERLNSLGEIIEQRFSGTPDTQDTVAECKVKPSIAQGFVTASLLFCVGAMAIVGSINSGLNGDHSVTFTKSTLDLITAAMLAVSLGVGVIFSAASVFVYQGLLVLLAQLLRPLLDNPSMLAEMNCTGSVIIIGLGFNIIGMTDIKVANYLPAIVFTPIICAISQRFFA
jgi:uncharacterized membrane protein YqgA involved in biofilm formation